MSDRAAMITHSKDFLVCPQCFLTVIEKDKNAKNDLVTDASI